MAELPYESLLGISYGLVLGLVPAALVGVLALTYSVARDEALSHWLGIAVAAPAAGALGLYVELIDPEAVAAHAPRLAMATVVVGLLAVVGTNQGNRIADELPRDTALPVERGQPLSAAAIDAVDAMGQVTIRSTGTIREFDGYPPLSPSRRSALEDGAWRFPADLQLAELEDRLERRLLTEFELSLVEVSVDGRGRATIAAAPVTHGGSRAIPDGMRAVTLSALLPTGIEAGDEVSIEAGERRVDGTVLAIGGERAADDRGSDDGSGEGGRSGDERTSIGADRGVHRAGAGFDGGYGRLSVAVPTVDAGALLERDDGAVIVTPRETNHEFQLVTLLERAGYAVTGVDADDDQARALVEAGDVLATHEATAGDRRGDEWRFHPDGEPDALGDRSFVVADAPTLGRVLDRRPGQSEVRGR